MHSFFAGFFKSDEDLNSNLVEELLDVLTMIGLQCMKNNKSELTILTCKNLNELIFHIAKFDKYGYSTARTAKRIMMIGIFSIDLHIEQVTKKVLELLDLYDSKVKNIAKCFHPRVWVLNELNREIDEFDDMFKIKVISPISFLKRRTTYYAWSIFKSVAG